MIFSSCSVFVQTYSILSQGSIVVWFTFLSQLDDSRKWDEIRKYIKNICMLRNKNIALQNNTANECPGTRTPQVVGWVFILVYFKWLN